MVLSRLRIGARCLQVIINVVYLPLNLINSFKKPSKCSPIRNRLLLIPARELAEMIRTKQIPCVDVIESYIARVQEVNPTLNAMIDDRFDLALSEAKKVDEFLAKTDLNCEEIASKFPFLGVPFTVKGSISVQGLPNTSGMIKRKADICEQDAVIVKLLKDAGAIPILTSNVPELCLNWETRNKLIGTTSNPYDTNRTVGGSSGGEAALLSSGASVIGLGSDICGSLRLPAHFCGVWGHKPTPAALSVIGHYPSCDKDYWTNVFTLGPMARYATDLKLLLHTISEPDFREKLKLTEQVDLNKIRIFYVEDINSSLTDKPDDEVTESMHQVLSYFEKNYNIKSQRIENSLLKYCAELSFTHLLSLDDIDNLFEGKGEGSYCELSRFMVGQSESMLTSILYGILRRNFDYLPEKTVSRVIKEIDELRQFFESILGDDGVLIFPTFTTSAHFHGEAVKNAFNYSYLSIFNALGFPATHCPVRFTKEGLPVGLQVVSAANLDRLTLTVAEEIEKEFGGWRPPNNESVTSEYENKTLPTSVIESTKL